MNSSGRKLYRSSNQAWLGGVCAGVAECYGQPVWLVRILMITLFVFSGSLGILVYLAGVFLLEKQPTQLPPQPGIRPQFGYGEDTAQRARQLGERMKKLDQRLQAMERYVTSSRYRFDKEFNKL
ncbi:phage shock protein C, PspC [Tolumonas auensis DSM 9187]|uniref:Phage shock protein C, PspC n=1 Tax=Tolumonas auensis (strain DSM 9187 / NBRC 110442 / TA 4) TaxID=595494 RepID=C4L7R6_TOLAT|nr:envelope stress response membrane protein PspC [Tolumonas auensis]ACQ91715.1 phage shock protein C, PspC [Tolumonas auensis DSM 9187]